MSLYVDIEKTFPDFKLAVQLESENDVIALLGGSGCGKSLTLKCIAGIEKPDRGQIKINGETVFDSEMKINIPPQKRNVGYLFQNYALFPTMTVWNNIACVIKQPKSQRKSIVDDMIEKFQLGAVKNLYPLQISGGQQQRTALARILVSEPEILMLDEPFSALDTNLRWSVEQEIAEVLAEFKGTTVFVSHNRDEVYRICDRIAIMNNGRIESTGIKGDVFDSPKTLAAASMTGCKNISKAEKRGDYLVYASDWGIELTTAQSVPDNVEFVGVRAHHLMHVDATAQGDNIFPCSIKKVIEEPFESVYIFTFSKNDDFISTLQFSAPKEVCKEWDSKEFSLFIPPEKVMCIE